MKPFLYSDWVRYKLYKNTLSDAKIYRHNIDIKLQDRQPINPDELRAKLAMYDQEIIDITQALRYYDGIENQFSG